MSIWPAEAVGKRVRVIIDNDFAGDPDGLLQLAHHLLSPSVDVRAVIGTHLREGDPWNPGDDVGEAVKAAEKVVELVGQTGKYPVLAGARGVHKDTSTPLSSDGIDFIIAEAMRDDTELPLYVACGASLTEIASAYLKEPRIADRLTVVWIGGHEHEGLAETAPGAPDLEYNLHQDVVAGQIVFNHSNLRLWQVPRDSYRSCLYSRAELLVDLYPLGELGKHLASELGRVAVWLKEIGGTTGDAYALGDSPLVLLTALQTAFEPDTASSSWTNVPCPTLLSNGLYEANPSGRSIRVYGLLDNRLMFGDMIAKFKLHAAGLN
jgi:inosine-uridine nucleoside N-ribohydrolase